MENKQHITELILKIADDAFILGHRYSEWIGIGPTLEEDISFGSIAQDKVGHAYNLYQLVETITGQDPDSIAFIRAEKDFKCAQFTELPNEGYEQILIRHFLYDNAEYLRYNALLTSSYEPLAITAKKFKSETKYHLFHANTWVKQLGKSGEVANFKLQSALNELYPLALGLFEPSKFENQLIDEQVFIGEKALQEQWIAHINALITDSNLNLPPVSDETQGYGGRNGYHSEHLASLLKEMREVFSTDLDTKW